MWFTPLYTTAEMKKMTGNPNFEYEISCDQMCGKGHYTMRGVIRVVSEDEFLMWRAKQTPTYATLSQPSQPSTGGKDSTAPISNQPPAKAGADQMNSVR
jgi:cytochrome c oxidase subunit 2